MPLSLSVAETPKTRSQRHLARRATPVLLSIQLTHVSCGVPEAWLGALNPQVRAPRGGFCSGSLKQAPAGAAKLTGVLAMARKPAPKPETLRRVTGTVQGYPYLFPR